MIRLIEDNNVFEAIQFMKNYTVDNGEFYGFEYNEAVWIKYFLEIVEQQKHSPHYLAIGYYNNGLKDF